jgi:hypothetical protein
MSSDIPRGDASRIGRKMRNRFGCAGLVLVIVLLAAFSGAMELFWTRVDQRRFPWAYAETGRPTLTGTWVGTFVTNRGARRGLYLDLRLKPIDFESGRRRRGGANRVYRRANSDKLVGELRMCGGPNGEQRFTITGNNVTDDASRFRLGFSPADSVPKDGLAPSHLRGAWDLRDSLRIEADLHVRQGESAITNSADPETGEPQPGALHRATPNEYAALCERLWTGR